MSLTYMLLGHILPGIRKRGRGEGDNKSRAPRVGEGEGDDDRVSNGRIGVVEREEMEETECEVMDERGKNEYVESVEDVAVGGER